jgi:hypothetical protein
MKTTTIDGVTLKPGSTVYCVTHGVPDYVLDRIGFFEHYIPEIKACVIERTNGTTFSFVKAGRKYAWVDEPERYFVTNEEAERALADRWKAIADHGRHRILEMTEQIASLHSSIEKTAEAVALIERNGKLEVAA